MTDTYLTVGGVIALLGIIAYAVKLTWKVRDIENDLRESLDAQVENLMRDVIRIERDSQGRAETLRHETGEVGAALRTKVHEVEVWTRDTFVRKDSFEMVIGRLEKSIEKLGDKIEDKMERIVERIQHRQD